MMGLIKRNFKKAVASATAIAFLSTTVAAPVAEANFWKERRSAVNGLRPEAAQPVDRSETKRPVQLARITASQDNPFPIDNNVLHDYSTRARAQFKDGLPALPSSTRTTSKKTLPVWMQTLSTPFGEIEDFYLSPRMSKAEKWSFSKQNAEPMVVLVQDVHNIPEAQKNISQILSAYQTRADLHLVGLEGAVGGFDLKSFRALPDPDALRHASDFVLSSRMISGAEHFGLSAAVAPDLWGVEKEDVYLSNISAYRKTLPYQDKVRGYEKTLSRVFAELKKKVYGKDLAAFDEKIELYAEGKIGLGDYMDYIVKEPAQKLGLRLSEYPNV
ncbi:MAG: hypothetical protein HY548_05545, partial [Elusimicrobia bacterium]|nr:hypothetical protein [Elusimicrobiota bacterium]